MSVDSIFNITAKTDEFQHDLEPGDHVIRWSRIVIYPIQVHGIVLSAVDDAVTIVDFGVSSDGGVSSKSGKKTSPMVAVTT